MSEKLTVLLLNREGKLPGLNFIQRAGCVLDAIRDHQALQRSMRIGPKDFVLDVGSGAGPNLRSNVLCDKFVADATERQGQIIKVDRPFVVGDAMRLPFADKSFDFVICSHVLEHVHDPAAVIRELERVAPRGYIETPNSEWEKVTGFPFHLWMVSLRDGVLVFERKRAPYFDQNLRDWFSGVQQTDGIGERLWKARRRAGVFTALRWEGSIPFEVRGSGSLSEFQHANVDDAEEFPAPASAGLADRYLAAWSRKLRRHSDVSWAEVEKRLVCPECRHKLDRAEAGYVCSGCAAPFAVRRGLPYLLPRDSAVLVR